MNARDPDLQKLVVNVRGCWLVTGVAGFIGSNLLESLLNLGQTVVGLDNFFSGKRENLEQVRTRVAEEAWRQFRLIEGDIRDKPLLGDACRGVDYVLHQAALGSVPRSIEDPALCHDINVTGFLHLLTAARAAGVKRMVYASSSAVYGDDRAPAKREELIGNALSPYAASKRMNEIYASVFARAYGFEPIGLRYFNIYGPRQDPQGAYAAVIPKWIAALLRREPVRIYGDGETSRDFCHITDVVQANLRAALSRERFATGVFNIASGDRTTLNQLFRLLRKELSTLDPAIAAVEPEYRDFRKGDIRHSLARIDRAREQLGFRPRFDLEAGLRAALEWYRDHLG